MKIACFIVHCENNMFCGTSRPGDENSFGFPGGKLEPGESLKMCAIREAEEEGFYFSEISSLPFAQDIVCGHICFYFRSKGGYKLLTNFKEKGRIIPDLIEYNKIIKLYNNEKIIDKFLKNI